MTVVPTSQKRTSTLKTDLLEFAAYARQQFAVVDRGTKVTSGKRLKSLFWLSPQGRFERCCAQSEASPNTLRYPLLLVVILAAIALALATGCGYSGSVAPVAIGGSVLGGHRPVSGASVELYAAGTGGLGSSAAPLLRKAVASDSNGNFSIPAEYGCPSASAEIYIVAHGGNSSASGGENSGLMLTALLGPCSGLSKLGSVSVNEVTTVGSIWPLAHYWKSPTHLGSKSNDASFPEAVATVPEFINVVQGTSPGTPTSSSYFAENNKLYSIADALAACVNSSGGKAGDGSPCGQLFSMASTAGSSAPTDTMTAAIQIAQQPDSNVAGIFNLANSSTPFQPVLTAAPSDWTLTLSYVVATPSISLASGTYSGTQEVTISDATTGSVIYYTTDGSNPSTSSTLYTGPISIAVSSTVKAMAVLSGSASAVASSALTITSALPPAGLAFLQQPSNGLVGATISPAVQVVVEDANGNPDTSANNPITLALGGGTGLGGTLTVTPQNGVATFNDLMVSVAGAGYTLLATSPGLTSATSTSFAVSASLPGPVLIPAKLVFLQQPSNGVTGTPISPAVQVAVEDTNGNLVTTAITPVTVTLTSSKGIGGTLWTVLPQNGIATFSNITVGAAGSGYTLFATSPPLTSATSAPFTISAPGSGAPPSPYKLAFLQQPMNALTQATITPAVQVVVEDSNGNAVQGANNPITLLLSGGSGFNGTLTVTPQNGVASFNDLSVSNAGTYTLQATSPGLQPATSASFNITKPSNGNGHAAVQLAFTQQPSNAQTGATISPAVQVEVEDSKGNVVTTAASPITITLAGGTGLGGTLTVSPQNGVATFSNLSVSVAGTGLTLTAASSNLLPATSTGFTISAPGGGNPPSSPVKLAFLQQPSNALTGAVISPAVRVVIEDANGDAVPTATNPITLTLAGGTGLGGTLTVTPQNGIATFSNLTVSTAGIGLTLSAASSNLTSATSVPFTINAPSSGPPPTPTRLAYLQQPTNALAGATIAPAVRVAVEDASGNVLPTATNPITIALVGGTGLAGTLTVVPQNGIATFSDLEVSNAGSGYQLSATSPGLAAATSSSFTITAAGGGGGPTPVKLAFSVQPTDALTQATITPAVQVVVQDGSGNVVTNATNPITLALTSGNGLVGTLTVAPQNGVATFSDLSLSTAGSYTLSAASAGLTSATSSSFTITAPGGGGGASPVMLAFLQQPSNALTGATISPAVQVAVEDGNGNIVAAATNPVTLTLVGGTGLGGTLTVAPQNGIATFSDLTVSNAGTGYTLSATSPSLTAATSTGFTITAPGGGSGPSPVKLAFSVQPTNAVTQATITPAVQVVVEDSSGNVVTSATNPVTIALTGGAGGLAGTLTATPQNGIATFNDLSVSTAGTYTLSATSTGLTSATSTSFTITSGGGGPTAAKLAFLVQPSHALVGATITPAVQVVIEDTNGNPVTNATNSVTLALSSGTGLGGTLTVTPQNGVATFSDLSLSTAGTYTLSASSPSLTSATSASFTISAPAPTAVKLAFSVQPSNAMTGATITPAVQVLVEDSSGNVVTNATSPVTVALVGGTGLAGTLTVTPQNGVATFSNLSVSNTGTYTLSASSPTLTSATSTGFTITAPSLPTAVKLAFSVQPSNAQTGATITPAVQVLVEDSSGNVVTNATNPVTVALVGGTGLTGTLTVTPQNGVATFSNLSVSNAGTYTLSASSPTLASATSTGFTITAPSLPTAVKLAFSVQPSNAQTGATITPAVQVLVEDSSGNVVTNATNPVTVALVGGTGLAGTLTVTPQNGVATFSNLSVSNAGTYTLSASSPTLALATSTGFTITAPSLPTAVKLAFSVQPSNAQTGATITPAVQVLVEDSSGNVVANATNPVTVALVGGSGLAGTLTVTPQNGIATFSNLSVSNAGSYTLSASSPSLTSATSTGFTITAPSLPAAKLAFTVQPSNAVTQATITPAVKVTLEDINGNVVTTATNPVTLALVGGTGLAGTLTVTPQNGVATFNNLTVSNGGSYTLSATSSGLTSATSAGFTISSPSSGATYYLSPSGSDSNNGLSASSPWLSPNHSLNCGDTIIAASGTYSSANFQSGKWGTVSCPAGNNVAWLICGTFDACKVSSTTGDAIHINKSYWGVTGWEASTTVTQFGGCFVAAAATSGTNVHHIIFANDVANGCMAGGFTFYNLDATTGVDYLAIVGNVAYNAAQGNYHCFSAISIFQPVASDAVAGTHMYVAGNFAYDTVEPSTCNGTASTDGEGVILDTFDGKYGVQSPYTQQTVVQNNITLFNGGAGILNTNSNVGSSSAPVYFKFNTAYGNNKATNRLYCVANGDIGIEAAYTTTAQNNIAQTDTTNGCAGVAKWAFEYSNSNNSVTVNSNWLYSAAGNTEFASNNGTGTYGSNTTGTSAAFANPVDPGPPSCSGKTNVPNCMATVISDFTPTNAAAAGFGYQPPSSTPANDPLFPQWLCTASVPTGLVTMGCE